ncbi:hypothetical protein ETD83_37400, partial [Actinomadura soli]
MSMRSALVLPVLSAAVAAGLAFPCCALAAQPPPIPIPKPRVSLCVDVEIHFPRRPAGPSDWPTCTPPPLPTPPVPPTPPIPPIP